MLEVGSLVKARLDRIEPYGAFLRHGPERLFVDHGNYSWVSGMNPLEGQTVGILMPVRILRYAYPEHVAVGSFKHVDPEANPYRQLSRLDADTILDARVVRIDREGATVELSDGVWGRIPRHKLKGEWGAGDRLRLRIYSLEVEPGVLTLEPVADAAASCGLTIGP